MEKYDVIIVKEAENIEAAIKEVKEAEEITNAYVYTKIARVLSGNSIIYENGYYSFDFFKDSICRDIFENHMEVYIEGYENRVRFSVGDDVICFHTQDDDMELFGGKVIKRGRVVFEVNRDSIIEEGEFEIFADRHFTIRIEKVLPF